MLAATAVALVAAACGGTPDRTTNEPTTTDRAATADAARNPLPEIALTDFEGASTSLTDLTGTPLVVNFWASWCGPCVAEMPDLQAVHAAAGDRATFVGINTQDSPEAAAELADDTGVTYTLLRDPDGTAFRAFEVIGMPSTFYVDAAGNIVERHTGLLTRAALVEDLDRHLGVTVDDQS